MISQASFLPAAQVTSSASPPLKTPMDQVKVVPRGKAELRACKSGIVTSSFCCTQGLSPEQEAQSRRPALQAPGGGPVFPGWGWCPVSENICPWEEIHLDPVRRG